MKKSVVILIAIIYVASIALVSFFGLKFKVFEEIVYVETVELLNTDIKPAPSSYDCDYYVTVQANSSGERRYQVLHRVHPDNATDQRVDFVLNPVQTGSSEVQATIDENGLVIFSGTGRAAVIVTVVAKNGTGENASVSLLIIAT